MPLPPLGPAGTAGDSTATLCMGCREKGQCRLGLEVRDIHANGTVLGRLCFEAEHEGAGGVAHGGSVMAAFDEVCGAVPWSASVLAVTAEMQVSFRRPVPIERELDIRAWPEQRNERGHWTIDAELRLSEQDVVLATARARFVERDPAIHYGRFHRWLNEDNAV